MDPMAFEKQVNELKDKDWEEISKCHKLAQEHLQPADIEEKVPQFPVPAPKVPRTICENTKPPQHPQQDSKLLSFPPEILEKIMAYAVGGEVVHIDRPEWVQTLAYVTWLLRLPVEKHTAEHVLPLSQFTVGSDADSKIFSGQQRHMCLLPASCILRRGPRFYTRICEARTSERLAWEEFKTKYKTLPANDKEEYYVADPYRRHENCHPWERRSFNCRKVIQTPHDKHRVAPFQVSRTFYEYAFRHFWQTLTFSFADTVTFQQFVSALLPHQRSSIKAINLVMTHFDSWPANDFDPRAIAGLEGLDLLNLSIHGGWLDDDSSYFELPVKERSVKQIDIRRTRVRYLLRLEVLDIKCVRVIVFDNEYYHQFDSDIHDTEDNRFDDRYTLEECRGLAKIIEALLTRPSQERKALAENDRRIHETENLLQGLKYAQDVRRCMQLKDLMVSLHGLPEAEPSSDDASTDKPLDHNTK